MYLRRKYAVQFALAKYRYLYMYLTNNEGTIALKF